jgi:putative transcriptional regulator
LYYCNVGQNPTGGIPMTHRIKVGRCLLLDILQRKGMTQAELSEITHISTSTISSYISNRRKMELRNAKIIATALNCHIDDLYEWRKR